jgi:hypothetical protein
METKMKTKFFIIAFLFLLSIFGLNACSGGSDSSGNTSSSGGTPVASIFGTISFNRTSVSLGQSSSTVVTLTLNNSYGINGTIVNLASSNSNIATVSPATCTLYSSAGVSTTGVSSSCQVTIRSQASSGTAQITATSIYRGHTYSITPVTVSVSGTSGLNFSTQVKGISQTIYSNQNYNAQFIFTNNTGSSVSLATTTITATGNPLPITINTSPCSNVTIAAGGTCTITGNGINLPANGELTQLNFTLTSTFGLVYNFDMSIGAVAYIPNYAAYRIVNDQNPGHTGWLVALGNNGSGQAVVQFNAASQYGGALLGSLLPQSASYAQGQVQIPATPFGLVVYQPNYQGGAPGTGIGGLMYVSLDNPVFETAGNIGVSVTNPSDPNVNISYAIYEPNVYNTASGQFLANLDVTAINFYGLMGGFYATDINTRINSNPGFLTGAFSNLATTTVFSQIQSNLTTSWPNNWGSSSQFAFNTTNLSQWVGLKGLVNYIGQNPSVYPTGFNPDTYTQYVADLWTYYAQSGHSILIDASEISAGCVLQASVNSSTTMLVQPQAGSSCPVTGTTGPNTFTWTTFQPVDFVGGAPGSWSTLYGANGTYRSMGKYVSAAQSVGFLPYCSNTSFIYGPTTFGNATNQANYWNAQYTCLANYASYGGSVMNQYDKLIHQYVPLIYGWAYDDALGISSEVVLNPATSVFTLVIQQFSP